MSELRVASCELPDRSNSRDAMHRRSLFSCAATRSAFNFPLSSFKPLRRSVRSRLFTCNTRLASRNALTLIELLITIAIIATLSTFFLGASQSAMEHSRSARTKSTIAKINTLLMERWGSYTTRRVDIHSDLESRARQFTGQAGGQALQDLRLLASRELMKMEMPDRWSDIIGNSVGSTPELPQILASRPLLAETYLRRYFSLRPDKNSTDGQNAIRANQGAECLYMIIMLATGDGEARTLFRQQDIGDIDNDGAPELLDGWGNPIQFARWPAGFAQSQVMTGDAEADHDPFDHFRRDLLGSLGPESDDYGGTLRRRLLDHPRSGDHLSQLRDDNYYGNSTPASGPSFEMRGGFRLVPLIYSRGSDNDLDLSLMPAIVTSLDPYQVYETADGEQLQIGAVNDAESDGEGWHDNLHNHLLDGR